MNINPNAEDAVTFASEAIAAQVQRQMQRANAQASAQRIGRDIGRDAIAGDSNAYARMRTFDAGKGAARRKRLLGLPNDSWRNVRGRLVAQAHGRIFIVANGIGRERDVQRIGEYLRKLALVTDDVELQALNFARKALAHAQGAPVGYIVISPNGRHVGRLNERGAQTFDAIRERTRTNQLPVEDFARSLAWQFRTYYRNARTLNA